MKRTPLELADLFPAAGLREKEFWSSSCDRLRARFLLGKTEQEWILHPRLD